MKRISNAHAPGLLIALAALMSATVAAGASAKSLPRNVLGLSPGMSEEAAHRILRRGAREQEVAGKKEEEEKTGRDEVWLLELHPNFAKVIIGFDAKNRLRYVTALAKDEGSRMSYSDVGPLKDAKAEESGTFRRYTWEVKPGKKSRGYFVIAQGRDPQYLASLSIKRAD